MSREKKKLILNEEFCKGCGFCISFCPDDALEFNNYFNSKGYHPVKWKGDCKFCGLCYMVCPDYVIEVAENEKTLER